MTKTPLEKKAMKDRKPGCFHPITLIYSAVGSICLLVGSGLLWYWMSAPPAPPPGPGRGFERLNYGIACIGGIAFILSGIVILSGILLSFALTRKK